MTLEIQLREGPRSSQHRIQRRDRPEPGARSGQARFVIDGAPLDADWAEVAPGTYSILIEGRSFEVHVAPPTNPQPGRPGAWTVIFGEHHFQAEIHDSRARRYGGQALTREGPLEMSAPMPGKVVKVLVSAGQEVKQDEGLVVIEAMKMQNELRAPRAGRVAKIYVQAGMGIEAGARLLRLE